ncbi:general stress protein [Enterococcus canis]|uniref:General stress protein n=1 Tax=Enterococcus canis TaxID=214095 RepID=A0A1L8RG08_9ENTE|nr:type 1 glutamine amidotransferase domain-containing protein [Enterococcus canis]OJG18721.1 general stress protein [Enterococcus canis]
MKVATILTDLVEDVEVTSPTEALEAAGHEVVLISDSLDEVKGKKGTIFEIDQTIDDTRLADYDALLIPGGFSPDQLRTDDRFVQLVKDFLQSDKPVFAICHGPQLFIQTELSNQLQLTAYESVQPDLRYAGATVTDEPVVFDQQFRLVTSRNPDDLPAFNQAIVMTL